jgi:fatty acid desaturase
MVRPMHTADRALNDRDILQQIAQLRQADNVTNWLYLAREYVVLAALLSAALLPYELIRAGLLAWPWAMPTTLAAIVCVGACQHRLATLTHEAAHYVLFRNRLLNELVSEWFCMFPMLGTTHSYRVQHLGHHQFPNDPERDPDWTQLRRSGHRYQFPMSRARFLWHGLFKHLLWPPSPIRYALVRARFVVDQPGNTPYRMKRHGHPLLAVFGAAYLVCLAALLAVLVWRGDSATLAWLPAALLAAGLAAYSLMPERWFAEYAIKNDIPVRWQSCLRLTFNTLLFTTLAALTLWTGRPWWLYYIVLWLVPLGTSFALFMILRQLVQHGNADRQPLTNTRIFLVHPLLSLAIFPLGQDYHLPHHLFPMVPHYNLRKLHALLLQATEYRAQAQVVRGYFFPPARPSPYPTVLELMSRAAGSPAARQS